MTQETALAPAEQPGRKFGTFAGVFTPTILTILGAIMYLRTGWVVGNAGLIGAVGIVVIANIITISTGLSIASVATNIRVRAGGAFSIISQSLGLEVGGSVSVPLFLALSISVAFYLFAFGEGWHRIFPNHPEWVVVTVAFLAAFTLSYISANLAARVQFLIMGIIVLSLVSVFLGSFAIMGQEGFVYTPEMVGEFPSGNFWQVFAVFFPAVTGVLAGVNMSGDLKDPRKAIPRGMLSAVVLTFVVYIILAYWLARVASPEDLVSNETIMVDKAAFGPAILAGVLAATFSSALTSMIGASRILQAISEHRVVPGSSKFAEIAKNGEPRNALFLTGGIATGALVFGLAAGGINAIAPLITMFFLIMYATLNGVVLLEQTLNLISFRPSLAIPGYVPLIGLVGCLFVMFLINPTFSLVAVVLTLLLYVYLGRRQLNAPWGDVRSGLFVTISEWAAKRALTLADSERAWKPKMLIPVTTTGAFMGSYRLLLAITYPRGTVLTAGLHPPGDKNALRGLDEQVKALSADGVFSRYAEIEAGNPDSGLHISLDILKGTFFRPNTLFVPLAYHEDAASLQKLLARAETSEMGVVLYQQNAETLLGREQVINVWIREQSPNWEVGLRLSNLDLALLLAYQLANNWEGRINLITVLEDEQEAQHADEFLNMLINYGRMPKGTKAVVEIGKFREALQAVPQADLNIFGLQDDNTRINLGQFSDLVEATNSSCLFVRDSGQESALA